MATSRLVSVCFSLNPPTQCLTSARLYITTGDRFLIERHFWAIYHPDMAVQHAEVATMTSRNSCAKLVGRCHRSKIEDLVHARERLQQDSSPMDLEAIECVGKPSLDNRLSYRFDTHTSLPVRTGLFEAMELDGHHQFIAYQVDHLEAQAAELTNGRCCCPSFSLMYTGL